MEKSIEQVVEQAKEGDSDSLEELIQSIQDKVFGLAFRMLGNRSDAEDAAQEILVRIITRLSDFRGDSAFSTWMFRVATNHILTYSEKRRKFQEITFEECEAHIKKSIENAGAVKDSDP